MSALPAQEFLGHAVPFVIDTLTSRTLHFGLCEIQSRMRLDDPHALELDYTRLMMGFLLLAPRPQRIAMLGLGGGSLAKFCHRHLPAARIEVVEINPHVIALRDAFHVPPDDARFRVREADGARYVQEETGSIDVLMVDGFDGRGQAGSLATQRFYDDSRDSLAANGLLVVNLHTGHPSHALHVDRIRRSFDGQALFVDSPDDGNTIAFGCKGASPGELREAARRRPARLDPPAAQALRSAFAFVEAALRAGRR